MKVEGLIFICPNCGSETEDSSKRNCNCTDKEVKEGLQNQLFGTDKLKKLIDKINTVSK
jgi:hypothetical protein